jgi:hypothetical protein
LLGNEIVAGLGIRAPLLKVWLALNSYTEVRASMCLSGCIVGPPLRPYSQRGFSILHQQTMSRSKEQNVLYL